MQQKKGEILPFSISKNSSNFVVAIRLQDRMRMRIELAAIAPLPTNPRGLREH